MRIVILLITLSILLSSCGKRNDYQKNISLSEDWNFLSQENPDASPPSNGVNEWQNVDLINKAESNMPINNVTIAEMRQKERFETGWYRKSFILHEDKRQKSIYLYFKEIFPDPEVWLNGNQLKALEQGNNSQLYKINKNVKFGDENIIHIREDSSLLSSYPPEQEKYIFRKARIITANPVHVKPGGINSKVISAEDYEAEIEIDIEILNDNPEEKSVKVISHIYHPDEGKVAVVNSDALDVKNRLSITQVVRIESPDYSENGEIVIYECVTDILTPGNTILDTYVKKFLIKK